MGNHYAGSHSTAAISAPWSVPCLPSEIWLSRKKVPRVQAVALAQMKDGLSKYLRLAAREEIVITRHGRPAGVLIGFAVVKHRTTSRSCFRIPASALMIL